MINTLFLGVSLAQVRWHVAGSSRWAIVLDRQHKARDSIFELVTIAICSLLVMGKQSLSSPTCLLSSSLRYLRSLGPRAIHTSPMSDAPFSRHNWRLDIAVTIVSSATAKSLIQLVIDGTGYPACFLVWLCPPSHPKICQAFHWFFVIWLAALRLYQLEARTNNGDRLGEVFIVATFTELLVLFELGHVVLGVKYYPY